MSDLVSASAIKDFLAECPICTDEFDEANRIPRRMPCCVQSVCQPCLETYSKGLQKLSCPICRHQHHLPGGVKSLPKEPLILKILDHLKIQKGLNLPCTDCPDKHNAVARCDDCSTFLCQECLDAHRRVRTLKDHKTITFEEMKGRSVESFRRVHHCLVHRQQQQFFCHTCNKVVCVSCTVVDHKEGKGHKVMSVDEAHQDKARSTSDLLKQLEAKINKISKTLDTQKRSVENIKVSRIAAETEINKTFDNLMEKLQLRKALLLSEVDAKYKDNVKQVEKAVDTTTSLLTKMKSSVEYMTEMRSKADRIEDLQLMVSSADSLTHMLEETSQSEEFVRTGITFVPANTEEAMSIIKASGLVRTVQFLPTPIHDPNLDFHDAITFDQANLLKVADLHPRLSGTEIYCPHLEWDSYTASKDLAISGPAVTNITTASSLSETGSRFQAKGHIMTSTPLVIRSDQQIIYQTNAKFRVASILPDDMCIFESALSGTVVDADLTQSGLSVAVTTCSKHKKICLQVRYDKDLLTDLPISVNMIGVSGDKNLCFLLDGTGKIHIIDVVSVKVVTTVTGVLFVKPLWASMHMDDVDYTEVRGELVSGNRVKISKDMRKLIFSLCK